MKLDIYILYLSNKKLSGNKYVIEWKYAIRFIKEPDGFKME